MGTCCCKQTDINQENENLQKQSCCDYFFRLIERDNKYINTPYSEAWMSSRY